MKIWNSTCHFLMIFTFTFDIYFTKGLKWITEPLPVNKCQGQTANLTWEYLKEPDEEITQLQWIFNRTMLIAFHSMSQGFIIEPKYQGRVSQSGETGILLHNISSKDIGNYTLYPLIKWEERPNIQTVRLNVIEPAVEPVCSCAKLSAIPEVRNGQNYQIVVGGCNLEINSSFCCPVGLDIQYCVNDPSKFCTPIRNLNNVIKRDPAENIDNKIIICVLLISTMCLLEMSIIMVILLRACWFLRPMISKKLKKITIKVYVSEDNQESLEDVEDEMTSAAV